MAQTNVQAFSGDVAISSNLAVDTNTLFVDSVGNKVGIGTNAPDSRLTVLAPNAVMPSLYNAEYRNGASIMVSENEYDVETARSALNHNSTIILSSDHAHDSGYNAGGSIGFAAKNEFGGYTVQYGQISGVREDNFYGGLSFSTMHNLSDGKLREDMRIINGNVGIGTNAPGATLHVYNNSLGSTTGNSTDILHFGGDSGGAGALLLTAERLSTGSDWSSTGLRLQKIVDVTKMAYVQFGSNTGDVSGELLFGTGDATERMRITSSGNVGIGTNNPLGKLHVQTEARSGIEGSGEGIYVTADLGEYSSGSEFRHSNQTQGTGIGYAGIYATGSSTNQDLNIVSRGTGTTYVKNYEVFSDDRIKTNEEYITNATETLMKLKPQVYDKHEEINVISDNPKREAGLIAQDIYYDAPELRYIVSTRNGGMNTEPVDIPPEKPFVDEDPTKDPDYSSWGTGSAGVAYIQLVPYLIKSIQELQERIKVLENKETSNTETSNVTTETSNTETSNTETTETSNTETTTETSNVTMETSNTETSNVTTETSNVA